MADNTNQIIFPAEWGTLRGRIAPSVQDSPSTYTIYARRKNGAYMDITGQTPTAKFTSTTAGGSVYTSTGTFTVTDGEAGEFTWLPSAADLGLDGAYYLQFEIDGERSEDRLRWVIQERLDSDGSTPPTAMTSLTAAQITLVQTLGTLSGLANFNGSGSAGAILIKLNGTAGPTVNDDSGDGYTVGSLWVDTTNDNAYICTDATLGAANWEQINGAGSGGGDLLAANNLSELTATQATARTNIGAAALGANTFTGEQTFADQLLTRPVIKDYGETVNAIGSTGGGTQDIDLTLGNVVSATVDTSANTFTFSNPSASGTACSFTLFLTNGGSQTVNWPASVDWAGATAPTLTASGVDILTFTTLDGGTIWYGFAAGLEMS